MLVRYYTGTYSEDLVLDPPSGLTSVHSNSSAALFNTYGQPRTSTSSESTASPVGSRAKSIPRGPAAPISQLPPDSNNVKLFQSIPTSEDYARSSSPSRSMDIPPSDRHGSSNSGASEAQKRMMERSGFGLPSSLPDSSPLSSGAAVPQENVAANSGVRANSELGHYPDLPDNRAAKRQTSLDHRLKDDGRRPMLPSAQAPPERAPTPDASEGKAKISAPMNGAPIPAGFKFGGRDAPTDSSTSIDRREKAKSRSFWGFGKGNNSPLCNQGTLT
jgi:RalA-binding protein 1